jgi:hypothetical protein
MVPESTAYKLCTERKMLLFDAIPFGQHRQRRKSPSSFEKHPRQQIEASVNSAKVTAIWEISVQPAITLCPHKIP